MLSLLRMQWQNGDSPSPQTKLGDSGREAFGKDVSRYVLGFFEEAPSLSGRGNSFPVTKCSIDAIPSDAAINRSVWVAPRGDSPWCGRAGRQRAGCCDRHGGGTIFWPSLMRGGSAESEVIGSVLVSHETVVDQAPLRQASNRISGVRLVHCLLVLISCRRPHHHGGASRNCGNSPTCFENPESTVRRRMFNCTSLL